MRICLLALLASCSVVTMQTPVRRGPAELVACPKRTAAYIDATVALASFGLAAWAQQDTAPEYHDDNRDLAAPLAMVGLGTALSAAYGFATIDRCERANKAVAPPLPIATSH